ncbi:hypothetical protein L21SP5_01370 [Salinivirga cyanobacteriivorans]|uniref:Uncharacterized protein n=1 Tax=Salinivirga cyanobacteriivorans TaxID=1307839 RepID=A0A0S2HYW6_9BACT|nr:hypothetical protein L21SP5_01370 [Salinivirga cyanobacteriivorans]
MKSIEQIIYFYGLLLPTRLIPISTNRNKNYTLVANDKISLY